MKHLFIMLFSLHALTDFRAILSSLFDCITFLYIVLCLRTTQRLEAMATGEMGESKIATKLANKTLSNASIVFKCVGHTYIHVYSTVPTSKISPFSFLSRNKLI